MLFTVLRNLQWRLVFILVSISVVLMAFVYVVLSRQVEAFYYEKFQTGIEKGLSNVDGDKGTSEKEMVEYFGDRSTAIYLFYVSDNRTLTVYDPAEGRVLCTTDPRYNIVNDSAMQAEYTLELQQSQNLLAAMASDSGTPGNNPGLVRRGGNAFFDYASLYGNYVLYFRYYREDWASIQTRFNQIILITVLLAVLISVAIGYLLSKTITTPITGLMNRARRIAAGDFDQAVPVRASDEIGALSDTFNYMAGALKRNLNEISREKNKVEIILNHMSDGVIAFDSNGRVIHVNPTAKKMLGAGPAEGGFNDYALKYGLGITLEDILYLDSPANRERDMSIRDKFFRVHFATFNDETGKVDGIIAVLHDVTEQQRLETMRREFVANVSHELRTPLTSIKSYAETLLDSVEFEPETMTHFLTVINSEADRMTRLVKDLLQLSRFDIQQAKLSMEKISFVQLVKGSVEKMRIEADNRKLSLDCYVIGNLPDIRADRDRIEQVVLNIISNAIKYTPAGGSVTVYLGRTHGEVYMKVKDTGIGIPSEDLSRVFERFYRVDKARSRAMGGTGLGLAIAKEIVEAHEGEIAIASEEEKGTEVTIRLPLEMAPEDGDKRRAEDI